MFKQLETHYNGNPMSFVVSQIIVLSKVNKEAVPDKPEETYIFVVGSEDPFTCSEPYDILRAKLDDCLGT